MKHIKKNFNLFHNKSKKYFKYLKFFSYHDVPEEIFHTKYYNNIRYDNNIK